MKDGLKQVLKWLAISMGGLLGAVVLFIAVFTWQRPWFPFMDDGPFKGEPAKLEGHRKPTQVYSFDEYTLEVYKRRETDKAPVVLLRDSSKQMKWSVYATGMENTHVESLEFIDHRTFFSTTVHGRVKWTYGNEAMWWYIASDGELEEYWYSW